METNTAIAIPEPDNWDDDKTPIVDVGTMGEIMEDLIECVRSPGIPTLTSDLPTAPHRRPSVINNMERT